MFIFSTNKYIIEQLKESYEKRIECYEKLLKANEKILEVKIENARILGREELYNQLLKLHSEHRLEIREIMTVYAKIYEGNVNINNHIHTEGSKLMTKEEKINISPKGDANFKGVTNFGKIEGDVTGVIEKLPSSSDSDKKGIKELLSELESLVKHDNDLSDNDKTEALQKIGSLEKAWENPQQEEKQNTARPVLRYFKGLASELPNAAKLVQGLNQLIPALKSLFGL